MQKFSEIEYSRLDIAKFKEAYLAHVVTLKEATRLEDQLKAIWQINDLQNDYDTSSNVVYIRNSMNTVDPFYDGEKAFIDEVGPEIADLQFDYYTALVNSPFRSELEKEFGKQLFVIAECSLKTFDKAIIEDLKEENKLGSEYSKLVASAAIDFDGKTCNLSELVPYKQSLDRSVRKDACDASNNFVANNGDQFDGIFDKAVKLRNTMAHKLGFKNFVELGYLRMQHIDYTPAMVDEFRKSVVELMVPLAKKLNSRQAKRIGIADMKHYDAPIQFKTGNPIPKGSPEWIVENGSKMYSELSEETNEFFQFMIKNDLMDLVTRKGKDVGGYCTSLANYGAPFIFSNFNGTSGDIDVLTHEAGHAFQVFSSMHLKINEYFWPTHEACEIHSMSMEFFTWPWMGLFFKEDTEKYKFGHLSSGISFLPYGCAVDEFQHHVYENPGMSPAERRAKWREMEKKYVPETDWDGHEYMENGGRWQLQSHIYQSPFYYIDYCLAQMCAFQFWIRMQEDFKGAWADYLRLCKKGGSLSFLQLVEYAGLKSPFERSTMETVVASVESWLDKVDDSSF